MSLLVGAIAGSVLGAALAGPPPTITTDGEACEGASLEERVRSYVTFEQQAEAGLTIDAHLRRSTDGQWLLDLVIEEVGGNGSLRQLVAPHCETVLDAAAFVVAVAIDPSLASGGAVEPAVPEPAAVPPPAVSPTTGTPAQPPATTSTTTATPKPRARKVFGLVRAGGGIDGGAFPRVGAMFEGAVGLGGKWFRAEVTGMYRLQTSQAAAGDPTVGVRISMWSFGARGCGVPRWQRVEFPVCAALEGGRQIATGYGLSPNHTLKSPWGATTFGPGIGFKPHKNIAVVVQAALGVPFVRTSFTAENLGTVYRTGPVFGRLWLGFEGRFP